MIVTWTLLTYPRCMSPLGALDATSERKTTNKNKNKNNIQTIAVHVTGEVKAHSYLLQRLSVAVQRGTAAAVMGTLSRAIEH